MRLFFFVFAFLLNNLLYAADDPEAKELPSYSLLKKISACDWFADDMIVFVKFISDDELVITDRDEGSSILKLLTDENNKITVKEIGKFSLEYRVKDVFRVSNKQGHIYYIAADEKYLLVMDIALKNRNTSGRGRLEMPLKEWRIRQAEDSSICVEDLSQENSFFGFQDDWDAIHMSKEYIRLCEIAPPKAINYPEVWNECCILDALPIIFEPVDEEGKPIAEKNQVYYLIDTKAKCLSIGYGDHAVLGHDGEISIWKLKKALPHNADAAELGEAN